MPLDVTGGALTVGEALAMPALQSARLVAGRAGLDRPIRWVHIVDISQARFDWGRRGVLLLTAGFGLADDRQGQAELIPTLVEQGFSGLVLSVGYVFGEAPPVMRQAAERLAFPLIETPRDVLFIDLTEAIFERLVSRQNALLQKSTRIHDQLTGLVLRGGELADLGWTLAGLIERSVTIEDPSFRVVATASHAAVDEARERSITAGCTTPEVARRLLEAGIYDRLQETLAPVRVAPIPDLGMTMERIVAPIVVGREIHGFLWIIAGDRALTDLDELAIGHGSTVAALMMFKEQAVRDAAAGARGDFFERLLRDPWESAELVEQAHQLDFRLDRAHRVLVVHPVGDTGGAAAPDAEAALFDAALTWAARKLPHALVVRREEGLVLAVESGPDASGRAVAAAILAEFGRPDRGLLVAVGAASPPGEGAAGHFGRSYEQAREALKIGQLTGTQEGIITFEELGLLHWLYHVPREARGDNPYLGHVEALAAHDAERGTALVGTLEAYLRHGGSLAETAADLYVHRNTLLHRMKRIERLCGLDLRDPLERVNLFAATQIHRLSDDPEHRPRPGDWAASTPGPNRGAARTAKDGKDRAQRI